MSEIVLEEESELDIEFYLAEEKLRIDINRNISKTQSNLIFSKVEESRRDGKINWKKLFSCFEYEGEVKVSFEKKIKDHIYNKVACEKKRAKLKLEIALKRCKK